MFFYRTFTSLILQIQIFFLEYYPGSVSFFYLEWPLNAGEDLKNIKVPRENDLINCSLVICPLIWQTEQLKLLFFFFF